MRKISWLIFVVTAFLSNGVLAAVNTSNAWARLLPPTVKTTAGYLDIVSDQDDRLLAASSTSATAVEIHQTQMQDGLMSMSEVAAVELSAGELRSLAPGGFHLMIKGLSVTLKEGLVLPVILEFEKAGSVLVEIPVRSK